MKIYQNLVGNLQDSLNLLRSYTILLIIQGLVKEQDLVKLRKVIDKNLLNGRSRFFVAEAATFLNKT